MNYGIRFPILLQRLSNLTKLIILHHHDKIYHCGVEATLNHIRIFYWIAKGRKTVKSMLRKCFICNVIRKKAAITEDTPALPPFRIQFSYCVKNVSLDYAGPLFYKDVRQNKMQKCYITLFTCNVSRAIHLELTNDLGVEPLKLAIRRFISRRGIPSCFISDNFKTFKSMEIKRFISNLGIKCECILERSPWRGRVL